MKITGYRAVWTIVLFDLPVRTRRERAQATGFRKHLLKCGFWRVQLSVYARPCASEENAAAQVHRVRAGLPPGGQVRIMRVTDRQYERMLVFQEKRRNRPERMPEQLTFF